MKVFIPLILTFLFVSFTLSGPKSGKINIQIEDLPNQGSLAVALYNSQEGFPYNFNKAYKVKRFHVSVPLDSIYFEDIPYGTYAISLKYDEFYVRADTLPIAYNHMTGYSTSGKNEGKFESSAFPVKKKTQTVTLAGFKIY